MSTRPLPDDEDLVTPEGALHLRLPRGEVLPELAGGLVRQLMADVRRPSWRAGFASSVAMAALLKRAGARPGLAFLACAAAWLATERLYEMAEDVHQAALAQRAHLAGGEDAAGPARPR